MYADKLKEGAGRLFILSADVSFRWSGWHQGSQSRLVLVVMPGFFWRYIVTQADNRTFQTGAACLLISRKRLTTLPAVSTGE